MKLVKLVTFNYIAEEAFARSLASRQGSILSDDFMDRQETSLTWLVLVYVPT
jgi:hypothetical protein